MVIDIDGGVGGVQGNAATFAADLAQAQAQLQSLQQFRAAAGGHHHKMASFSFPNMLPNMMAANMMGMGLGGINLLQQQQQQFQQQLQQQSNQPQRKSLFAPYLPQASLPPLLAAGKLVVGILRVNKRNRSDAYVATEVLDADIYICGSKDRNRALEGDIVAVELLDVDEVWSTKKEKEEKKRKKEENSAYDHKSIGGRKDDKKKDDVEVEGQGLMLFEDEEQVVPLYQNCHLTISKGSLMKSSLNSLATSLPWLSECLVNSSRVHLVFFGRPQLLQRKNKRPNVVNARAIVVMSLVVKLNDRRLCGSSLLTNEYPSLLFPPNKHHLTSYKILRPMPINSLLRALNATCVLFILLDGSKFTSC